MKDENTDNGETKVDAVSLDLRAFELSAEAEDVRKQLEEVSPGIKEDFADDLREIGRAFRAANVALEHSSYSVAVQLYEKALAKSAAVMNAEDEREAAREAARADFWATQSEMEKAREGADLVNAKNAFYEAYCAAEKEQEQADSFASANDFEMAVKHARAAAKQFSALHCQKVTLDCEKVSLELKKAEELKAAGNLMASFKLIEKVLDGNPENANALALKDEVLNVMKERLVAASSDTSRVYRPGEERIMLLLGRIPMVFCWCKGFWMGKYVVTNRQYRQYCSICGKEVQMRRDDYPETFLSWYDCESFVSNLNSYDNQCGYKFAMPTSAQWEQACRAGTTTRFSFGDELTHDVASFGNGSMWYDGKIVPVGSYPPNAWGLHEMHGNVYEWCADRHPASNDLHASSSVGWGLMDDPTRECRILRGGCYWQTDTRCSSSFAVVDYADQRDSCFGFRLLCHEC